MSHTAVRNAIEGTLAAAFPDVPIIPLVNLPADVPVDTDGYPAPFIATFWTSFVEPFQVRGSSPACWREIGSATIVLYVPSGAGEAEAELQAISDLFTTDPSLPVDPPGTGLTIQDVSRGDTRAPMKTDSSLGSMWSGAVVLGYQFGYSS